MLRSLRSIRAVGVPRAMARRCSTLSHAVAMRSAVGRAAAAVATRRVAGAATGAATRTVAAGGVRTHAAIARHMSTATYNITVPPLGDSVTDATVAEVRKNVGDAVAMDEIVALMETDKVAVDVRAPEGGAITALNITKGSVVKVGDVLMTVAKGAAGKASAPAAAAAAAAVAPLTPAAPAPAAPKPTAAAAPVAAAASSHGRKPMIQFRYGKANSAKTPAATGTGASADAALTGPAKYRLPVSVFSADVFALDVSAGERWTGVPDSLRRAPLSDAVIALIELGGAVDSPAPAKAKGGKGAAKKK